ncbi:MAG: RNA polymerase sigma factor [Terriglobia bacterium]
MGLPLQGDEETLSRLYDRISPALRGMLMKILGSPEEAEEVLEESFLKFWKLAREMEKEDEAPEVWLVLTARRAALRRHGRMDEEEMQNAERPGAAWLPRQAEVLLLSSRLGLLARSFAQLSMSQRQMLEMAIFEGLCENEIADVLGTPAGRARDEVRAALTFMRQQVCTLMGTWTADI